MKLTCRSLFGALASMPLVGRLFSKAHEQIGIRIPKTGTVSAITFSGPRDLKAVTVRFLNQDGSLGPPQPLPCPVKRGDTLFMEAEDIESVLKVQL